MDDLIFPNKTVGHIREADYGGTKEEQWQRQQLSIRNESACCHIAKKQKNKETESHSQKI